MVRFFSLVVCLFFPLLLFCSPKCSNFDGPKSVVENYLSYMKKEEFSKAYSFLTDEMTDGRSRSDWAGLQRKFFVGGDVSIFSISVGVPRRKVLSDPCILSALVPNILRSRDKFNNQGTTEFEVYTVVKQANVWKVDSLEVLFSETKIADFFPDAQIPKFYKQLK